MLKSLTLRDVGPAPEMNVEWAPRLNFIAGDNGLGKTFLLDIAWWALTRTWARLPAAPSRHPDSRPSITFKHTASKGQDYEYKSTFSRETQTWSAKAGRPPIPGMVIYAQVDGGFSAWDPARNYWKSSPGESSEELAGRPRAYLFKPQEVWDGLPLDAPSKQCNGLIADWAAWQREKGIPFEQLTKVLRKLSPSEAEPLEPGPLTRLSLADVRDQPTLQMPYAEAVALAHASAGMRRVVALAYLLVWTWQEHLRACELLGTKPVGEVIFLIDEVEAHLHPKWQRRVVPALLEVMEALTGQHEVNVQLIAATHSPLILASVEPHFKATSDALWELKLDGQHVSIASFWHRYGDVNSWLASEVFQLGEPRSLEAEQALQAAHKLLVVKSPKPAAIEKVDRVLRSVLSDVDPFWVRWGAFRERQQ